MPQREIEDMWVEVHRSIKPYIKKVKDAKGAAAYLGKYLNKERASRFIWSAGWILPGFVGWSKNYRQEFGQYPGLELVRQLGRLDKVECNSLMNLIR